MDTLSGGMDLTLKWAAWKNMTKLFKSEAILVVALMQFKESATDKERSKFSILF